MLLLSLDFETTGLDPKIHSITEVGAVLYDTDCHRLVKEMGYLIDNPDAVWDEEVHAITHLTTDICQQYGHDDERSLKQLLAVYNKADVIIAHNGTTCDKPFFEAWCARFGYAPDGYKLWVDTMVDVEYPSKWNKQLTCLAAYHGFLNPFPHSALADALTTLLIVLEHDLDAVLTLAKSPTLQVQAIVSKADKDKAKARGFYAVWDEGRFIMWAKDVKECHLEAERAAAGFPLVIVTK